MHEPTGPQRNSTGPDDRRPPGHPADDVARLEGMLQQLQHLLEDHADDPLWVLMQPTREAGALAHRLLHGWQVQQAMTQGCLTRWQQTLQTLKTVGVALQCQAETHQAPLRRAPWWAVLAGLCLIALPWVVGIWLRAPVVRERCQTRRRGPVSGPEEADPPCTGACGDSPAWQSGLLLLEVSHATPSL